MGQDEIFLQAPQSPIPSVEHLKACYFLHAVRMNSSLDYCPGRFKATVVFARHVRTSDLLIDRTLVGQLYGCDKSPCGSIQPDCRTDFP